MLLGNFPDLHFRSLKVNWKQDPTCPQGTDARVIHERMLGKLTSILQHAAEVTTQVVSMNFSVFRIIIIIIIISEVKFGPFSFSWLHKFPEPRNF